jgi:ribose/xylose/arabinose/galactoside ABC-type transport system permease subunit
LGVAVDISSEEAFRRGPTLGGSLGRVWTVLGPFLGLIVTVAVFSWLTWDAGSFLTVYNWRTISVQTVIVATAALGMTLVMISGGIDLSVGSVVALVCVAIALAARGTQFHLPAFLGGVTLYVGPVHLGWALLGGVLLGGLCGLLNGWLITALGVVPFIITLGSLKVFRGTAKWLANSTSVYVPEVAKPWWLARVLATEPKPAWLVVAPGVWLLIGLSALLAVALRYSLLGRYIYAVGSNEATARLCGIRVPLVKVAVYTLAGLATGLAGVLQFAYLDATGDPVTAEGMELQVIAAVVIGGASLSGGEGTVLGTLIGCLIMSVLNNGCVHAGISNASQDVFIGVIIVVAVALDRFRRRAAAVSKTGSFSSG